MYVCHRQDHFGFSPRGESVAATELQDEPYTSLARSALPGVLQQITAATTMLQIAGKKRKMLPSRPPVCRIHAITALALHIKKQFLGKNWKTASSQLASAGTTGDHFADEVVEDAVLSIFVFSLPLPLHHQGSLSERTSAPGTACVVLLEKPRHLPFCNGPAFWLAISPYHAVQRRAAAFRRFS